MSFGLVCAEQVTNETSFSNQTDEVNPLALEWLTTGKTESDAKNYGEAEKAYEKAIEIDPVSEEAWKGYLSAISDQEDWNRLLTKGKEAAKKLPSWNGGHYYAANALNKLKRFDEAIVEINASLTINPDYEKALNLKGLLLRELKNYDDSLTVFEHLIAIHPDYLYGYYNKGRVLVDLEQYEDALAAFDATIEKNASYQYAWFSKGNALHNLKREEEAIDAYNEAITIDPTYAAAITFKGISLEALGKKSEAIDAYDLALSVDPGYTYAADRKKGLVDQPVVVINPEVARSNDAYGTELKEASLLSNDGKYEDAMKIYETILTTDSENLFIMDKKASLLKQMNKPDDAMKVYDQILSINPDYPDAKYSKAMLYESMKQYDKAIALYEQMYEKDPKEYWYFMKLIGDILYSQDKNAEALPYFLKHLDKNPNDLDAMAAVFTIYLSLGNEEEAQKYYQKVKLEDPDYFDSIAN
ncbi:MAG: tetratricopeptide repeat protein [Methanospirillum sp.]|uniref:tetratricopeptide repeat protein n=1 Tax=Methanospirillum sp. TaxID=45200 RepID=UPI00237193AC|nr:tetratricopeptide repeat protein [Methanospirillum sp.]MDD1730413.1 tetratricopeptide repeat protein [Methanospirillum sp.]